MRRIHLGIFLVALDTLMVELLLTRVFDVILTQSMAYMVITCAMFAFGLAGVYATLRPAVLSGDGCRAAAILSLIFAAAALLLRPALNALPFNYQLILTAPVGQAAAFAGMYLMLAIPFFCGGLILTILFASHARRIQVLYFVDLVGAGIGCVILIPFLPVIGPGGLLFCSAGLALWSAALFLGRRAWTLAAVPAGLVLIAAPFHAAPGTFEFIEHANKRGVKIAHEAGQIEFTRWDPVSKIEMIDVTMDLGAGVTGRWKHVAYDGGTQSSFIYPFDGDFARLRHALESGTEEVRRHFWFSGVLAAHYLKRDRGQHVLIVGSAAGQETKAALMYGAGRVDALEMVGTVVDLGTGRYAGYNGGIFTDPRVRPIVDEGRSFLRASRDTYDIVQIFSNNTSSSVASGAGAMKTTYLHTAEAYRGYFDHLSEDGILQINHDIYPRVVTTAALAWKQAGRRDLQRHVLVLERDAARMPDGLPQDNLPTTLIKMQPWTQAEIDELAGFLARFPEGTQIVEDPLHPANSLLSSAFYSGDFPAELDEIVPIRVAPVTDDRPYFEFLRKKIGLLAPDRARFTNASMTGYLNADMKRFVPFDIVHLFVTGAVSLGFVGLFLLVPLLLSEAGRRPWPGRAATLGYFACLGAGFMIIEIVFIDMFMKLIGPPLYTCSTVIFTMLVAAGIGSFASSGLTSRRFWRWTWPFLGIAAAGGLLHQLGPVVFSAFLSEALPIRVLVGFMLIFPLGFFLGMPFPTGILAMQHQPRGVIAWCWAMNGLATVIGGFASVLMSVLWGFHAAFLVALGLYLVAFALFAQVRRALRARTEAAPRTALVASPAR